MRKLWRLRHLQLLPGQNLGAYGDGGALVSNNTDLYNWAVMFANHGRVDKYDHRFEGINSRLDGIQAAILDVKLSTLRGGQNKEGRLLPGTTKIV